MIRRTQHDGDEEDCRSSTLTKSRLAIAEEDIARYETDGAICLRGVIQDEWIERLRDATERLIADGGQDMSKKGESGRFVGDLHVWRKDETFRAFALEGPTAAIAKALMRSNEVRLFSDQLFVKEPGTSSLTPWHHDQTYWPVLGDHVCSVWVPMDPVTVESSGLEYIRGSHRWGRRFDPEAFGDRSLDSLRDAANEKMPDIDADRASYDFLSWDLGPGDCLVHHSLAVHGAGGNRSQTVRRRAISTRWFGDQAVYRPTASFPPDVVGLQPGAPMTSAMFPRVV